MTGPAWTAFLGAAALGAVGRYLLDGRVHDRTAGAFPWGTLAVNITGCVALGMVTGLGLYHGLDGTVRTVIGSGGLGAYTTFSTFTYETVRLAEDGRFDLAARNIGANMVAGLVAAGAGLAVAAAI